MASGRAAADTTTTTPDADADAGERSEAPVTGR
jgi:hypothetical protein